MSDRNEWQRRARRAAEDHDTAEQANAEAAAEQTVDYLVRLTDTLHLRPTDGAAERKPRVVGDEVLLRLMSGPDEPQVELRATVSHHGPPVVHAWLQPYAGQSWIDRGQVETLVDLGHALDPTHNPNTTAQAEPNASVGDMLATVLTGIVREVVHDVLDGRLGGDGQA